VPEDQGLLWVSTAGFYLQTDAGLFPWAWVAVRSIVLTGPGAAHVQGTSQSGEVSWLLQSDWAELVFVLWAMAVHPNHPSLPNGGWLPPGWRERAQLAGYLDFATATELRKASEWRQGH
jgi:hypothetical protein